MSRALILLLVFAGCTKEGTRVAVDARADFAVDSLFTHGGCTVFRFSDGGWRRYFARCSRGDAYTSWTERRGKSSRPVGIPTAVLSGDTERLVGQ